MEQTQKPLMTKTAAVCFVVLLFIAFAYLFVVSFNLLLLLFGGLLLSILFHAISDKLRRWTGWHKVVTFLLGLLLVLLFFSGISWLIGATLQQQYDEFSETIPKTIDNFKSYLGDTSWGQRLLDNAPSMEENSDQILSNVGNVFKSTFGFFGDLYALLFLAVFFMVSPNEYKQGLISLFPEGAKSKAGEVMDKLGNDLKVWLKAQLLEMLFVFTLTAIGMLILGIDLWLILALIAGTLTFIPNIGPTLALIPAALVGLLDGVDTALYIIGIFLLVQTLESGVFGPYVRKKMLSLPPALVLFFQFMLGAIAGAWGLLFATPLLVVITNLVNEIYVKSIMKQKPVSEGG